MKLSKIHFTALSSVLASALLVACGGSQPEPETPAPPAAEQPAPVAQATAAATSAPAPAAAEAAPPPAPEKPKPPPGLAMLFSAIGELKLTAEQKPTVEAIQADMLKSAEPPVEAQAQLTVDIADGVAAGKIDKKKTGEDVKALVANADEGAAKMQDTANRLHKALDPEQRKQLADSMAAKHEEHNKKMEEMLAKGPDGAGPPGKEEMKPGAAAGHSGAPGQMKEHGHGHGHGDGEGMGMMMCHHMRSHLDMIAEAATLTPEQKDKLGKKLDAEVKAEQAKMKAHMKEMDKKSKAVGDAFKTDKFDAKKVGLGVERSKMAKEMAEKRVKMAELVLGILTPEQRGKFADHIREHFGTKGAKMGAKMDKPEKAEKADKTEKADKAGAKPATPATPATPASTTDAKSATPATPATPAAPAKTEKTEKTDKPAK